MYAAEAAYRDAIFTLDMSDDQKSVDSIWSSSVECLNAELSLPNECSAVLASGEIGGPDFLLQFGELSGIEGRTEGAVSLFLAAGAWTDIFS